MSRESHACGQKHIILRAPLEKVNLRIGVTSKHPYHKHLDRSADYTRVESVTMALSTPARDWKFDNNLSHSAVFCAILRLVCTDLSHCLRRAIDWPNCQELLAAPLCRSAEAGALDGKRPLIGHDDSSRPDTRRYWFHNVRTTHKSDSRCPSVADMRLHLGQAYTRPPSPCYRSPSSPVIDRHDMNSRKTFTIASEVQAHTQFPQLLKFHRQSCGYVETTLKHEKSFTHTIASEEPNQTSEFQVFTSSGKNTRVS